MQCVNCQFENFPGQTHCARCRSPLCLDDVCVVPRRASFLSIGSRLAGAMQRTSSALAALAKIRIDWRPTVFTPTSYRAFFFTLMAPGTGHLTLGQRGAGWTFLSLWSASLVFAFGTAASMWGAWWLTVAALLQAGAISSLLAGNLSFEHRLMRLVFGGVLFLFLYWIVYIPATLGIGCLIRPLPLNHLKDGSLLNGDGIVYQGAWLRPTTFQAGDLVVFNIPEVGGHYRVTGGVGVDRVLAVPGQRIDLNDGVLTVNGAPPAARAASLVAIPPFYCLNRVLQDGEYLIIPSSLTVLVARGEGAEILSRLAIVPAADIRGRVLFRAWPWSRIGPVH